MGGFLGSLLQDKEIMLIAIVKTTVYSINILNVADECLKIIAGLFQDCIKTAANASAFSKDKIAALQKILMTKENK